MNTENTNRIEAHRLNLTDKYNLKDPKKNMALANLSIYYTWKNIKPSYNKNKFQLQLGMMPLIYQMDLILFLTFKITFNLS